MADLNFQPLIQPYVAPPVAELDNLGRVLNDRYEKNLAQWDELDFMANSIPVLQNDTGIRNQAIEDLRNVIGETAQSGRWESAQPVIREAVKRFRGNTNLRVAAQNYKRAQEYNATVEKLRQEGKTPLVFGDYQNFSTIDPKTGQARSLRAEIEQQLDYRKAMETYFNDLQASRQSTSSSGEGAGADGLWRRNSSSSSFTGITPERIQQQAINSLPTYLQSAEGQQQLKVLTKLRGLTPEQALSQIQQDMIVAGSERIFGRTEQSSSSQYVDNPYLSDQLARTRLRNAQQEEQSSQINPAYIIDRTELSDSTAANNIPSGLFSNTGLQDVWKYAFSGDAETKTRGKFELQNLLSSLGESNNPETKQFANQYRDIITEAERLFGDRADDYLQSVLGGDSDLKSSAIANSRASTSQIAALDKKARQLKNKSTGLIFDSKFEDEIEDRLAQKTALQVGWLAPKLAGVGAMSPQQRGMWDAATKDLSLDMFDVVRGPEKDLDKLKDRRVSIERVSNGPVSNGKGVGFIIRDKEGQEHIATLKDSPYGNQKLQELSEALGATDLPFKDRFRTGVNVGETKSLEQIASQNNLTSSFSPEIKGVKIRGVENNGNSYYEVIQNGKPYTVRDLANSQPIKTREELSTLANTAIRSGAVKYEDIVVGRDSQGDVIDRDKLFRLLNNSNTPVKFNSQYDIYRGYLR